MSKDQKSSSATRGLLNAQRSLQAFDIQKTAPSAPLAPFVETYWIISWDLGGQADYIQQNLPHPSVNLVVDPQGQTGIFGVHSGVWSYELRDQGTLIGTKFHPGAFHAFAKSSISKFSNRCAPISSLFGRNDQDLNQALQTQNTPQNFLGVLERMLLEKEPILDKSAINARRLVEVISRDAGLTSASQLADQEKLQLRELQRLFETYVGASPKWVIDRYRMLAAVDAINAGEVQSLTSLAYDLGYFDQAHFTKAFRKLTGHPPSFFVNAHYSVDKF